MRQQNCWAMLSSIRHWTAPFVRLPGSPVAFSPTKVGPRLIAVKMPKQLARVLGRMSDCERSITQNLEQVQALGQLDDISKAQLLLGYLADVSGEEEITNSESINEQQS